MSVTADYLSLSDFGDPFFSEGVMGREETDTKNDLDKNKPMLTDLGFRMYGKF